MAFDSSILKPLTLRRGAGKGWENGLCFMEAAAWLAGEEATDRPKCACPILGKFGIAINDLAEHHQRQKLLPLAYRMAGTNSPEHAEARTAFITKHVRRAMLAFYEEHRHAIHRLPDSARSAMRTLTQPLRYPVQDFNRVMDATVHTVRELERDRTRVRLHPDYPEDLSPYLGAKISEQVYYTHHALATELVLDDLIEILEHAIWMGPNGQSEWERYVEPAKKLGEFAAKKLKPHPKQFEYVVAKGAPSYGY